MRSGRLLHAPDARRPIMTEASTSPTAAGAEPLIPASPLTELRYDRSIAEGPLLPAVWKIAWPTMLQNMIGWLQGVALTPLSRLPRTYT